MELLKIFFYFCQIMTSNQAAQYRLLTNGLTASTKMNTILEKLESVSGEILANGHSNDVTNYTVEPVIIQKQDESDEQRYVLKAKLHDFDFIGYLRRDGDDEIVTDYALGTENILANGKLYTEIKYPVLLPVQFADGRLSIVGSGFHITLQTTTPAITAGKKYAVYSPDTNEFQEITTTQTVSVGTVSRQITFARGKQLYACSPVAINSSAPEEPQVYNLVPVELLS